MGLVDKIQLSSEVIYHHYFLNSVSEFSASLLWVSKQKMYSSCSHEAYLKKHIPSWTLLRWALLTCAPLMVLPQSIQDRSLSHGLHGEHKIMEEASSPQLLFHSPTFSYKWLCPLHLYLCFNCSFTQLRICPYSHIYLDLISLTLRRPAKFSKCLGDNSLSSPYPGTKHKVYFSTLCKLTMCLCHILSLSLSTLTNIRPQIPFFFN